MSRGVPAKYRLLHGPYKPPPLCKGDRTTCLFGPADSGQRPAIGI